MVLMVDNSGHYLDVARHRHGEVLCGHEAVQHGRRVQDLGLGPKKIISFSGFANLGFTCQHGTRAEGPAQPKKDLPNFGDTMLCPWLIFRFDLN